MIGRLQKIFRGKLSSHKEKETSLMWQGNYADWNEAILNSSGYNEMSIFEKVRNSLRKVKTGEAVYERDSVLFDKIQYAWPLLACLENIAIENDNTLHVIDFGGSLGS